MAVTTQEVTGEITHHMFDALATAGVEAKVAFESLAQLTSTRGVTIPVVEGYYIKDPRRGVNPMIVDFRNDTELLDDHFQDMGGIVSVIQEYGRTFKETMPRGYIDKVSCIPNPPIAATLHRKGKVVFEPTTRDWASGFEIAQTEVCIRQRTEDGLDLPLLWKIVVDSDGGEQLGRFGRPVLVARTAIIAATNF